MSSKNIVVVGIYVVDLSFVTEKLPSPGETIIGNNYTIGPGGKGSNQAVAISRTGGHASLIARIGDDQFGQTGIKLYESENVNTEGLIIAKGEKTGAAAISIDKYGMNSIVVVPGASKGLTPKMVESNVELLKRSSSVLTGFEIPLETLCHTIKLGKSLGLKTILNPAPFSKIDKQIYKLVDYLTPNEHEASSLTGVKVTDLVSAQEAGKKICDLGVEVSIITLGEKGVLCTRSKTDDGIYLPAIKLPEKVIDTVGAGDVFNGAFATAINEGQDLEKSLTFANKAASISVRNKGAALSAPYRKEINNL